MTGFVAFLGSVAALFGVQWVAGATDVSLLPAFLAATAAWAAWDSDRIRVRDYVSGVSYSPVVLFFAISMCWGVGFPWYLAVRSRIRNGTQPRKCEAPAHAS